MVDLGEVHERPCDRTASTPRLQKSSATPSKRCAPTCARSSTLRSLVGWTTRIVHCTPASARQTSSDTRRTPGVARALHSLRAIWEGRLEDADEHIEAMESLAKRAGDPNAVLTYLYQRMRVASTSRRL